MYMHTMYEEAGGGPSQQALARRPARFVYRQQMLQQRSWEMSRSRESSCDTSSMESEVRSLRQEVAHTQDSLRAATRRCRELVRELDGLSAEHERERLLRDQQLSRILRALLVLESRLKQEQKSIRQLLCEKDNVIRNQQLEIAKLRRYTKSYIKGQREQQACCAGIQDPGNDLQVRPVSMQPRLVPPIMRRSQPQEHESGLSKDIQKLKCEIITKLNEGLDAGQQQRASSNIRKTHSFAGSDISKASLTSSEHTDASIITTTTDGSPSLLSTEGFCEGDSTDVSPGSTLNKGSSSRCTPTILTTDSENEVTMLILEDGQPATKPGIARSESKDDGMDCNYASDEDEDEPIYENNKRNLQPLNNNGLAATSEDCSNNNVQVRLDEQNHDESSGNWYSDPDEDRLNDEMLRHSVYRPNGNHNSVLECVNQILLRDMEDEENVLSVPRRFKHRGKIVRFQPARLSDIESVGSEMERRNSEEPSHAGVPQTATRLAATQQQQQQQDGDDHEPEPSVDGFEATNSEDEFGMRIVPVLDPESGLEEDVDDSKARPIVIIEPCVPAEEPLNNSNILSSLTQSGSKPSSPTSLRMERIEEKTCLQMSGKGLTIAKNLDYEDIDSLPEIISPPRKVPPALPPKPQFRNNTLILKKIPSPSFLIDETSRKKQNVPVDPTQTPSRTIFGLSGKNPLMTPTSVRSLKFDDIPRKNNNDEASSFWKNRFNNVRSSFTLHKSTNDLSRSSPEPRNHPPKVTNIVRHFEEFKIEGGNELSNEPPKKPTSQPPTEFDVDEYDIQQNFEEFNLDECDLSDDPDRPEADGSETFAGLNSNGSTTTSLTPSDISALGKNLENNNTVLTNNGTSNGNGLNYDNFLEATGLSNKSILTPSRLLSNHKSMLKPKDVKYKSKIKASAVLERHGISLSSIPGSASSTTHTKHWTGPFV
ncbi:uncharacterized protein LOC100679823 isoform X2 [Nasonia vitripennis]|uniref:Uncharacterized protein n=1 Tax=Nasonia vitripennis TaxID=7425 RepID=A0A7M7IM02_NASVI|nr:uncharacterized protein LOC100679823 isoform X2 [Nasonia vitripennis]